MFQWSNGASAIDCFISFDRAFLISRKCDLLWLKLNHISGEKKRREREASREIRKSTIEKPTKDTLLTMLESNLDINLDHYAPLRIFILHPKAAIAATKEATKIFTCQTNQTHGIGALE